MKISTKGRYALRLCIYLAKKGQGGRAPLREVGESQGISMKYLEQLASLLSKAGLLQSVRGAHGGYCLTRDPVDISAGDILRATEGGTAPVACLEEGFGICPRRGECETIGFWQGLDDVIEAYVDGVSLAELAGVE